MTREEIEALVKDKLVSVAPDIAGEEIEPDDNFRDQFEIDSMDFLNFIEALHKATDLDFPEDLYDRFWTLNGCVDYIEKGGKA